MPHAPCQEMTGAAPGGRDVQSHRYAGFDDGAEDAEPAAPGAPDDDEDAGQQVAAASMARGPA